MLNVGCVSIRHCLEIYFQIYLVGKGRFDIDIKDDMQCLNK